MKTNFGSQLRPWRRNQGLSQLDLATRADVSQRHISLIESDRSRPSPEMIIHLAEILQVAPREQNLLLTALGHATAYSETPCDDLHSIGDVLDFMLSAHEPNLATFINRRWEVVRANSIATPVHVHAGPRPSSPSSA